MEIKVHCSIMSGLKLDSINSAENEFFAEETIITIIPNVDLPRFDFISGTFGPLSGGMPVAVPLWFAITLRKRGKCTVQLPEWMTVAALEARVASERTLGTLSDLPFHYMEIAQLLLTHAKEDIPTPDRVAVLLQDLENIRMDRIKLGVMGVADTISRNRAVVFANLNNASAQEILTMKRFFVSSLYNFYELCPSVDAPVHAGDNVESGGVAAFCAEGIRSNPSCNTKRKHMHIFLSLFFYPQQLFTDHHSIISRSSECILHLLHKSFHHLLHHQQGSLEVLIRQREGILLQHGLGGRHQPRRDGLDLILPEQGELDGGAHLQAVLVEYVQHVLDATHLLSIHLHDAVAPTS